MTYVLRLTISDSMPNRPITDIELTSIEKDILLKYFPKGVCAFDLEMTGLSPLFDKIIEIAAMKLTSEGEVKTYHTLVNPLIPVPEHTTQYHGLTNKDLGDSPTLKAPLREFLEFVDHAPLIAHNGMFDASFLFVGMNEFRLKPGLSSIFDTCKLARHLFKSKLIDERPTDNRLSTLAEFFEIEFDHHRALDDAAVCLKIMAKLLETLEQKELEANFKEWSFLFKLNSFLNSSEYILSKKILDIKQHVQRQIPFEIKYKGGSVKDEFREIKPLALLAMPRGLILYAECKVSKFNKYFRVKKIQKIRIIKEL